MSLCVAYQVGLHMVCGRCDIRWNLNDPMDRPRCQAGRRHVPAVDMGCLFCRDGWHRTVTPQGAVHHTPVELDDRHAGPFKCEVVEIDPIRGGVLS